jgi:hypothetical protein
MSLLPTHAGDRASAPQFRPRDPQGGQEVVRRRYVAFRKDVDRRDKEVIRAGQR